MTLKIPEFRQNSTLSAEHWAFTMGISVVIKFKIQQNNSRHSYKFRWKRQGPWNLPLYPSLLSLLKMTSGSHFTGTQVFPPTQAITPLVPENKNFYTAYACTVIAEGWVGYCYSIPNARWKDFLHLYINKSNNHTSLHCNLSNTNSKTP